MFEDPMESSIPNGVVDKDHIPAVSPPEVCDQLPELAHEQRKDDGLREIINFLDEGKLLPDDSRARKIALQAPLFTLFNQSLHFIHGKR